MGKSPRVVDRLTRQVVISASCLHCDFRVDAHLVAEGAGNPPEVVAHLQTFAHRVDVVTVVRDLWGHR